MGHRPPLFSVIQRPTVDSLSEHIAEYGYLLWEFFQTVTRDLKYNTAKGTGEPSLEWGEYGAQLILS